MAERRTVAELPHTHGVDYTSDLVDVMVEDVRRSLRPRRDPEHHDTVLGWHAVLVWRVIWLVLLVSAGAAAMRVVGAA